MFEFVDVDRLDAGAALDVVEQAQTAKRHAEVQEALAMLRVVKTYRHQIPTDKVRLGGDGTGLVDDFACLELAAALHRSVDSVTPQVTELVNLEVRLPRLWEITIGCGIPLWLARRIARTTGDLSLRRALWVDATIAPFVTRLAPGRLLTFVDALVVQADPEAAEARWTARHSTRVEIGVMGRDGLRDIYGWLSAADATYLDAALEQLSGILAGQGSTDTAAERRATALGILATPARALALIQHSIAQPTLNDATVPEPDEEPQLNEGHGPRSPFGCAGHTCGTITVPTERLLPTATLIIHLSEDTLTTGVGVGRCEQLGPLTVRQIPNWWAIPGSRSGPCSTPTASSESTTTRSPPRYAAPSCNATATKSSPTAPAPPPASTSTTPSHTGGERTGHPAKPAPTPSDHSDANPTVPKPTPAGDSPNTSPANTPGPAPSAAATSSPPPATPTTTNTPPAQTPGTTPSADHSYPTHHAPAGEDDGRTQRAEPPLRRGFGDPRSGSGPKAPPSRANPPPPRYVPLTGSRLEPGLWHAREGRAHSRECVPFRPVHSDPVGEGR